MIYVYAANGMHCQNCANKIERIVGALTGIEKASVDLLAREITVTSEQQFSPEELTATLSATGSKLTITPRRSFLENALLRLKTFTPLIASFGIVILYTLAWRLFTDTHTHWHKTMQDFMAGFFFVFGGLKAVSWKQFAEKFASYDILAARSKLYGQAYPGIELGLGILYATGKLLTAANLVTIFIMLVGIVGIQKQLSGGKRPTCACIGGWFSVPISKVTIAENLLMAAMAAVMLLY
jgi:copper chaperone CopZ